MLQSCESAWIEPHAMVAYLFNSRDVFRSDTKSKSLSLVANHPVKIDNPVLDGYID
jgi:hypothetical protein